MNNNRKIVVLIIALQLVMWGMVRLELAGYNVPILRQILGFIYLDFIPGFLILRVLKMDRTGVANTILYSVGLSIALIMFAGLFMNVSYPAFGITRPISLIPITLTLSFIVLILCAVVYGQKELTSAPYLGGKGSNVLSELITPPSLFLILLPILSILGAMLVNIFENNLLLLLVVPLIGLVPVLVAFNKFIPKSLCYLAIWSMSISLLWHVSMVSWSLGPFDIVHHYDIQRLVLNQGKWDPTLPAMSNAMMSVVMLAPFNSLVLQLDTLWIFKLIYPFFLSLVPLALFQVVRRQTGDKVAFLAVFFFMSMPAFFHTLNNTATQLVAEMFLALSIMLLISSEINPWYSLFLIIFSLGIIISHYGTSYVFQFYLLLALPIEIMLRTRYIKNLIKKILKILVRTKYRKLMTYSNSSKASENYLFRSALTGTFVALYAISMLSWYIYTAGSTPIYSIVNIINQIKDALKTDILNPMTRDPQILQALGQAPMRGTEIWWNIARIWQYVIQGSIITGVIALLLNLFKRTFSLIYSVMALISMIILGMAIILPFFTANISPARIYHLSLFFLSPFAILGANSLFRLLVRITRLYLFKKLSLDIQFNLVFLLVFIPYFLFTTGFIFEITGATSTSPALSSYREDFATTAKHDIIAVNWLKIKGDPDLDRRQINSDWGGISVIYGNFSAKDNPIIYETKSGEPYYFFVRKWVVVKQEIKVWDLVGAQVISKKVSLKEESPLTWDFFRRSKIYDNGSSQILGPS